MAARLVGAGGRGMGVTARGWGERKTKKPPGGPGGFFGTDGDDAERRGQRHEFIMHNARGATTSAEFLLRPSVKPGSKPQAAFLSSFTALSTSSTWPGTFRP